MRSADLGGDLLFDNVLKPHSFENEDHPSVRPCWAQNETAPQTKVRGAGVGVGRRGPCRSLPPYTVRSWPAKVECERSTRPTIFTTASVVASAACAALAPVGLTASTT